MGRRQRMGWIHIEQKVSRYRRVYLPHRSSNSDEKGETRIGGSYGGSLPTEKSFMSVVPLWGSRVSVPLEQSASSCPLCLLACHLNFWEYGPQHKAGAGRPL